MKNVLELEEFNIIHEYVDEENKTRLFEVDVAQEPFLCTKCGSTYDLDGTLDGKKFKKHDTRIRTVRDLESRGYKIIIKINQRRYNCPECHERFTEFLECLAPNDKVTRRLFFHVGKEALKENFLKVANKHGISVDTVKRAFMLEVAELDSKRTLIAPRVLGIDEIYIKESEVKRKQPYLVLTDIENKRVIEFVKGTTKDIVVNRIKAMKGYENIEVVTMDMATTYRYAVEECCPKAFSVVDHFHVMQKFGMALNTIRANIQSKLPEGDKKELFNIKGLITLNREDLNDIDKEKLDSVLSKYPKLEISYQAKELLREVYKCETKYDANQKYFEWEQFVSEHKDIKEVKGIQKMINKLRKEIFAYFDGRWTNAYTECANSLIRRIIRDGNGYSFDVLRAKILYGTPASKQKKVKIKDMNFNALYNIHSSDFTLSNNDIYTPVERTVTQFYTDINELIAIMDRGEF
ncbi:ISL3 family transposase [Clostridium botulinum D/C]|uniref:ISL3 family transposase n=1 Tax=Clostridium botulinum TaxID=1491 RepID=UPI001E3727E1|nr:ISL3 family transposase [Clostridium botulinum]MCD3321618.1 ISL3 family transposase [Clostridium botulinum D/C]MCD3324917.1 ISL3 family transposase [Clostridium botulinum D/C]MCD3328199.1 ISL3 family transposase [Clostridium botulinum D/C]